MKIFTILLLVLSVFFIASCGDIENTPVNTTGTKTVTTTDTNTTPVVVIPVDQNISVVGNYSVKYGASKISVPVVDLDAGTGNLVCSVIKNKNLVYSTSFNSVTSACEIITSSSTVNYFMDDTMTKVFVMKEASALFNTATTSFTLTVRPTVLQIFRGGFYHDKNVDAGIFSAYSTKTGRIEKTKVECREGGVVNSHLFLHYGITTQENIKGQLLRCGYGVIFGDATPGIKTTKLDGQAVGIIDVNSNEGSEIISFDGFSTDPANPAGGFVGMEVIAASDIPLESTRTLESRVHTSTSTRKIYRDGVNPARTYQFQEGDYHVINDPNISVGDKISNCEKHQFISQNNGRVTTTVICEKKGPVFHKNDH